MPRLLTLYGLARELGMSVESLRRWMDEGVVPEPPRRRGQKGVFTEQEAQKIRRAILARRLWRAPRTWIA